VVGAAHKGAVCTQTGGCGVCVFNRSEKWEARENVELSYKNFIKYKLVG